MRRTVLVPLLIVPLLAACGAGGRADTATSAPKAAPPGGAAAQGASAPEQVEREVVRTATIDVTVKDASAAADRAVAIARQTGGRVDTDRRSVAGDGSATLVLRVPPAKVEQALSALSRLGKETRRGVDDEDVTTTAVDLASRVATQRASVARVRALLDRAESLADVTKVEAELTRRQADLESLLARQKALAGKVDLATVTATLSGTEPPPIAQREAAGFLDGLAGGWHALTGTARVLSVVAGALLPFSWLVLVAVAARVALLRRRRTAAV